MRTPPPPRYRVTERGRRLEVVDTWRDPAAAPPALVARGAVGVMPARVPSRPAASPTGRAIKARSLAAQSGETRSPAAGSDGVPIPGTTLRTLTLFDEKAPRTIPLDAASWRTMLTAISLATIVLVMAVSWSLAGGGLPALGVLGIALGAAGQHGRAAITRWLDRLEARGER